MSSEHIDYRIRPAKHIERKMLSEVFRCLSPFGSVENYRYWGFGAIYFADFVLFHRALGVTNMLSMERDTAQENRFRFNVPYDCITLDCRPSNEVLPTVVDWDVRTVAWFDYTDKLSKAILGDIDCFIGHACAGSILLITVNCQADRLSDRPGPLEKLKERVGEDKVPKDLTDESLTGTKLAVVAKRVIDNEINDALNVRNGTRAPGSRFMYRQLVHFRYSDGAKMLTVGGLVFDEGQEHVVSACGFGRFSFVRTGEEPYEIEAPMITLKEKRHMDRNLPTRGPSAFSADIPAEEARRYERVYRYFPSFADIEP
jgi:hypothetical protein